MPEVPEQLTDPCGFVQASPQAAQFAAVPSDVSQPGALVQSTKPGLQPTSTHEPVAQDSLAFGRSQVTPHAPQLPSEVRLASQPLSGFPSQSLKPGSQVGLQS